MIKKIALISLLFAAASVANAATNRPSGYTTICKSDETCSVSQSTSVAFGASGQFVYKVLSGTFTCNVATFGSDPIPSKSVKECSIPSDGSSGNSSSSSSSSSSSGSSGNGCGSGGGATVCLSASGGSSIKLSWSVSGSISSAQVYRDTDSNPSGRTRLAILSGSERSYTDSNVSSGKTYYYWIKFGASGSSYNSGAASATASSGSSSSSSSSSGGGVSGSSCTSSKGNVTVKASEHPKGIVVKSGEVFDGGCKTYTPDWGDCGQAEGQQPVFRVEGGTLKNVIVGQRGDGIHIRGNATIDNIYWPNVCEDALTIKEQANVTISNITGYDAADKFFQANAKSTVVVKNAIINNVGKVLREKGGSCYPVKWTIKDSKISNTKEGVFRSDCGDSEFELINVQLSGVPEVCVGDNKSCKY